MPCFWIKEALADAPATPTPLEGEQRADVCIVGGGFTGLWTAIHLRKLRPDLDIALIEKDICGAGASGRNGGFVLTWSSKILSLLKICDGQEAVRLVRSSEQAVKDIGAFCEQHGIKAHFRQDGWLWTASNESQRGAWAKTVEELDRLGANPFVELPADAVARRGGSERNVGGIFEPGAATVQPALLARGLARVVREQGVRIYERSPMRALERGPNPVIRTERGSIRADRVVLALNAWAAELPDFRRTLLPLGTDIVATDPAPERVAKAGITDGVAVSDSRLILHYYRTTPDGRMVLGKGAGRFSFAGRVGDDYDGPSARGDELEASLRRFFPYLGGVPVAEAWQGPVTRTGTGLPFFGHLRGHPNIVYGHGYCGNGVGPSYMGGRIVASLALGLKDEWTASPVAQGPRSGFPPEPFRYAGAHLVRGALARIEDAADEGRTAGPVDRSLARLAPAGMVPTKTRGARAST